MGFSASVAADYKLTDNPQTITYTAIRAVGTQTFPVAYADGSHTLSQREINGAGGFYQMGDRSWVLGAAEFAAANSPLPGDTFVDATGVKWAVITAELDDLGIAWDCTCRKGR